MSSDKNTVMIDQIKEAVIRKLKHDGGRMTRQRELILDIILNGTCLSCKEIYYKALASDPNIGTATVYRMINLPEEMGVIRRENMYKITDEFRDRKEYSEGLSIEFDDGTAMNLTDEKCSSIMEAGLKAEGYIDKKKIKNIVRHRINDKISQ